MRSRLWSRLLLLGCTICLCVLCLTACTSQNGQRAALFSFCGGTEFAETFDAANAACLVYRYTDETPLERNITDPETIQAVFDALSQITVEGEAELYMTDSDTTFLFQMKTGESYSVSFEGDNLLLDGERYRVSGDETLRKLAASLKRENR